MDWFEIIIKVPTQQTETAAAIANMTVPYGIYIEDYSDLESQSWEIAHVDLIDQKLIDKDRENSKIHIYISKEDNTAEALSYLKERFTAENIHYQIETAGVKDIDWNEYWKSFFHAFEIGNRLAVVPKWEEYENIQNRCVLKIDPGAAFGTGTHATTALCLELLEKNVKDGMQILDVGCGSGILAIASALLGENKAVGVDIDPVAVKVARDNAVMNSVENNVEFYVGDLAQKVNGKYNIVCANIVADVIIRLLENIDDFMYNDSSLIVSGIIDLRVADVKNAIENSNFYIDEELTKDNWYAFVLKLKENS